MAKVRKLFTNQEILKALNNNSNHKGAAKELSRLRGVEVSPQLVRYWDRTLREFTKRDGTPYAGTAVADRAIREQEVSVKPATLEDYTGSQDRAFNNDCILVIPDLHAPYQHPDALDFLIEVAAKYKPTRVINLGDETDGHALSFHDSDPNLDSAGVELHKARKFLNKLEKVFPVMQFCHSNHGSLIFRRAHKSGIPVEYIKSYREILFPNGGGQGWTWHDCIRDTLPNGQAIQFQHQSVGDYMQNAAHERCNIVLGHEHGKFQIEHKASKAALYWGLYSGCLIDSASLAFAYGKLFPKKPIIGCSIIIDSQPILIPMLLDDKGRWVGKLGGVSRL